MAFSPDSASSSVPSYISRGASMSDPDTAMHPSPQRTRAISFADRSISSLGSSTSSINKRRQHTKDSIFHHDSGSVGVDLRIGSPDSVRSLTSASTREDASTVHMKRSSDIQETTLRVVSPIVARAMSRQARHENDMMVYLEGPSIYACSECGTHLSSHDDIISKSFHGRHGRAFLLENCVNVNIGPAEDRHLLTGLHSVCDLFCKRCDTLVGWTYKKAYERSQKYKEGKFIIEKIYLSMLEDRKPFQDKSLRIRESSWGRRSFGRAIADRQHLLRCEFALLHSADPMICEYTT
ncbi:hypothetical protein FisN_12Hh024 [Fistulifera solaris]|uniref:Yippee domain-containing protein n=1 Tax=Fistulifera solaris TaxID=1519565 RepID=A0A1Z5K1Z6_FISSO|nr:hypothetical protein FisN_12Hh024 [Fistulifera solaris]|eukprot:GAX20179.1 hypothetical protein FisN_12Hh024 [Fistulifera solaris]